MNRSNTAGLVALALVVPAMLVACGSSSSPAGTGASTSGTSSSSSSSTSGTTSSSSTGSSSSGTTSSSSTSTSSSSSGASACQTACINNNTAAYAVFENDLLSDCGCAAASPCVSECGGSCTSAKPNSTPPDAACTQCLDAQESQGQGSTCTTSAGIACLTDQTCTAFVTCAEGC